MYFYLCLIPALCRRQPCWRKVFRLLQTCLPIQCVGSVRDNFLDGLGLPWTHLPATQQPGLFAAHEKNNHQAQPHQIGAHGNTKSPDPITRPWLFATHENTQSLNQPRPVWLHCGSVVGHLHCGRWQLPMVAHLQLHRPQTLST